MLTISIFPMISWRKTHSQREIDGFIADSMEYMISWADLTNQAYHKNYAEIPETFRKNLSHFLHPLMMMQALVQKSLQFRALLHVVVRLEKPRKNSLLQRILLPSSTRRRHTWSKSLLGLNQALASPDYSQHSAVPSGAASPPPPQPYHMRKIMAPPPPAMTQIPLPPGRRQQT